MPIDKLSGNSFATGAIANSLGYTPANKAGDTFTGALAVSNTLSTGNTTITGFANVSSTLNVTGNFTGTTGNFSSYLVTGSTVSADPGANYYSFTHRMGGSLAVSNNISIGSNSTYSKFDVGAGAPNSTIGTQAGFFSGAKAGYAGIQSLPQNQLAVYDTTTNTAGSGGAISLMADCGSGQQTWLASIEARRDSASAGNYGGSLNIYTRPNGNYYTSPVFAVSSSGCVTMPRQPSFRAYLGTEWSTINAAINSGWTVQYDRGGNFNQGTFTAPVAGSYFFSIMWDSLSTQGGIDLRVNGQSYARWEPTGLTNDSWESHYYATPVYLQSGDYVTLYASNGSGSNPFHMGSGWWGHFGGYLIG